jgi:hypothetical protein
VNSDLHDVEKGLRYARIADEQCPDWPIYVDALACARARADDFENAVALEERAIKLFETSKDFDDVAKGCGSAQFYQRLNSFRAGQAYQGEQ